MMVKTYTDRSNARRAAKKAGIPAEEIGIEPAEGGFRFFDMREEAASIDDHPKAAANAASWDAIPDKGTKSGAARKVGVREAASPHALRDDLAAGKIRHTEGRLRAVAEAGLIPPPPDFSAPSHARWAKHLDAVKDLVARADIAALQAYPLEPKSSSRVAILRYRDAALIALAKQAEPTA